MVSKYYDQPIKNAVLCNGGTLDSATYPELSKLLGFHYGGSIAYDSVLSEYGISSSDVILAYSEKHDTFLGKPAMVSPDIKLFRRGSSPVSVTLTAGSAYTALPVDDYFILVNMPYNSSSGKFTYLSNLYVHIPTNVVNKKTTGSFSSGGAVSYGAFTDNEFIYCANECLRISTLSTSRPITVTRASEATGRKTAIIPDFDNLNSEWLYYACFSDSTGKNIAVYRFPKSILRSASSSATSVVIAASESELVFSCSLTNSANPIRGAIYKDILVISSDLDFITAKRINANTFSARFSTALGADNRGIVHLTPLNLGTGMLFVKQYISDSNNPPSLYSNVKPGYIAVESDGTTRIISSSVTAWGCQCGFGTPFICLTNGAKENVHVSAQKLPNISLSESLVYMRTKGA